MIERKNILSRFDLSGRGAIVTGGSKGIGKSLATALSEAGAKVLISARGEADLKKTSAEISAFTGKPVDYCTVDLSNRESTKNFAAEAERILGNVDIFIANAAAESQEPVTDLSEDNIDSLLETNLVSNMLLTREFSKKMKERGWGRIVYISSASVFASATDGHSIYSSTKSALHSFTRTTAVELGGDGITVNAIAAGTYYTEMADHTLSRHSEEVKQAAIDLWSRANAVGRWGRVDEMEGAVLLLASDAGSFITGSVMTVDGGLSIRLIPNYLDS